jgi:hypothetical protein
VKRGRSPGGVHGAGGGAGVRSVVVAARTGLAEADERVCVMYAAPGGPVGGRTICYTRILRE